MTTTKKYLATLTYIRQHISDSLGIDLFDHLRLENGTVQLIARDYDPAKTPVENLPGGRFSQAQRFFLEKVWQPRLRPPLVKAGFWRVGTIGG